MIPISVEMLNINHHRHHLGEIFRDSMTDEIFSNQVQIFEKKNEKKKF